MAFNRFRSRTPGETAQSNAEDSGKALVLVIDDDLSILKALEFTLKEKYKVKLCNSGDEGIRSCDDEVRAVILDIKMPGKNGLQVYEEIRGKHTQLPIIFYSAFQDLLESMSLRRQYKPFGYFDKNGEIDELFDCVDKAVKHYEQIFKLQKMRKQLESKHKKDGEA